MNDEKQTPWAKAATRINRDSWPIDPKLYSEFFEREIERACREHAASLQAEVERLRDAMTKAAGEFNGMSLKLTLERDDLLARVERLRKTLKDVQRAFAGDQIIWNMLHEALATDTAAAKEAK